MVSKEDLQAFIDRLDGGTVESEEVEPGLWRVKTQSGAEVVINYAPPVALLRVRVMEVPQSGERRGELYRQLLQLNVRDMIHGSYGLEGDHVVLSDALELTDLDYSEFEASFDSLTLAIASHLSALAAYRER
jgi:hypothetical protein